MIPFVKSEGIINLVGLASIYKARPSSLFDIEDPYTAFCFDEACAYISAKIKNGEEPKFKVKYSSFSDMYKNYS